MSKDRKEIRAQTMQISRGKSIPGRGNRKCKGSEARNIPVWLEKREQEERMRSRKAVGSSQKAKRQVGTCKGGTRSEEETGRSQL